MPGLDRMGPLGMGPRTGGGWGLCGPRTTSKEGVPMPYGRGFGFRGSSPPWPYVGRGRGGMPRCAYPGFGWMPAGGARWGYTPAQETDWLKAEAEALREELPAVEKRLAELEKKEG